MKHTLFTFRIPDKKCANSIANVILCLCGSSTDDGDDDDSLQNHSVGAVQIASI